LSLFLFLSYLRSLLGKYAKAWRSCLELIQQWGAASTALTHKVKCILWPLEGSETLQVRWWNVNESEEHILIDDETVLFMWYKLLYIIGNPNEIEDPDCFLAAMTSLSSIVNEFNAIGNWTLSSAMDYDKDLPSKTPQPKKSSVEDDPSHRRSSLSLSDSEDNLMTDFKNHIDYAAASPKQYTRRNPENSRRYTSAVSGERQLNIETTPVKSPVATLTASGVKEKSSPNVDGGERFNNNLKVGFNNNPEVEKQKWLMGNIENNR
jgi:hypothetical protein